MSGARKDSADVATEVASRPTAHVLASVRRLLAFWEGGNAVHPLKSRGTTTIGRSREADIRIDHTSVSRLHLVLHLGDRVAVEDLGSANGTWLNGTRLEPRSVTPVRQADIVEAGSVVLLVQEGSGEETSTGPVSVGSTTAPSGMERVKRLVELVADSAISVLLLGETGVGKDVTARAIHTKSPRVGRPFVGINCAALPEALLESELFGHERGAFTGAVSAKQGLLESAEGGTVFLNEVAELPLTVQAKLLSALETREVIRVGGVRSREFDVRFIAATNQELERRVETGEFRQDLFFRLNGITIRIPPLRERLNELPSLIAEFMREGAAQRGKTVVLSDEAYAVLESYAWPGNVRELRSVIERAALLASGGVIGPEDLDITYVPSASPTNVKGSRRVDQSPLRQEMVALERQRIEEALRECDGNQTHAAKLLGMSRRTLVKRLGEYSLTKRKRS